MTNVSVQPVPDPLTLEQLIASTDPGILMETSCSWPIDDKRYNFQFGLEIRRDIFGGKRRRMLRQIASVEFQNSVVMSDSSPSRCRGQPTR